MKKNSEDYKAKFKRYHIFQKYFENALNLDQCDEKPKKKKMSGLENSRLNADLQELFNQLDTGLICLSLAALKHPQINSESLNDST